MSFVDAYYNKADELVHVVERVDGQRIYREFPAEYTFYYPDPKGKYKSIFGDPVARVSTHSKQKFYQEKKLRTHLQLFESDIYPVARILENEYKDATSPKLHSSFFDIEVDFDKERGHSPVTDPFNKITAISVYLEWLDQLITFAIPPSGMDWELAQEFVNEFDNTFLYLDEKELLHDFLVILDDADLISGWNSEAYDIPYLVNRYKRIGGDLREFCLSDREPVKRKFERYGSEQETYDFFGRVHLDYMELYRTYTYHEMHSYSLDAISEYELDEHKVPYEGTLDQLYNDDFYTFIEYNRQDAMLVYRLDKKLRFIDLANLVAHDNTVLIPKILGTVAVTEQAIINEAHDHGVVIPDKIDHSNTDTKAAGAYVVPPRQGLHKWIGSVDINSLYPSVFRAYNMSIETLVAQLRPIETDKLIQQRMAETTNTKGRKKKGDSFAKAWEGLFSTLEYTQVMEKTSDIVTVDWVDGSTTEHPAYEIYDTIFNGNGDWCLTANGTIFSYEKEGIIPGLLARWYRERQELQANKKRAQKDCDEVQEAFWHQRQLSKKIMLNALYGALLNAHCRFWNKSIGQSTTLGGRSIAKHMHSHVNEQLTGKYEYDGQCIVAGDTDSSYFSGWPIIEDMVKSGELAWDRDTAIAMYNQIGENVNDSFPAFMKQAFNCPQEKGEIIRCAREVVGSTGIFIKKKRYAIMVLDNEGKACDVNGKPGKLKAMGLDLKRSDTPPVIQEFLKDLLMLLLTDHGKQDIVDKIIEFKKEFINKPSWEKGTPKRVNKLTKYVELENESLQNLGKSARLPGHVRAAYNFNNIRHMHNDKFTMEIQDGMKTIVCKLKPNIYNITSIARPIDEHNIPDWFKELPFDDDSMELTVLDKKVENLLGILNWNLKDATDITTTFNSLFTIA